MRHHGNLGRLAAAGMLMSLIACTDTSEPSTPSTEIRLAIQAGNQQVGSPGEKLPLPLAVRVTNPSGAPLSGIEVRWLTRDAGDERPRSQTSQTDANGVATLDLILGDVGTTLTIANVGAYSIEFTSIALVQGAAQIARTTGDNGNNQIDTVLSVLPSPYRVLIRDHLDRPVAGVLVKWLIRFGGGKLVAAESRSDARGVAEMSYTLGMRTSTTRVEASVDGLKGSPVRFDGRVLPGKPVEFRIISGTGQFGKVGTAVARPYIVAVVDNHGNRVSDTRIDWSVVSGGGSVEVGTTGFPSATHKLGLAEGPQVVSATAVGLTGAPTLTFIAIAARELVYVASEQDYYSGIFYNFAFVPADLRISAGTRVLWAWQCDSCFEFPLHNVVFEDDPAQPTSSPSQGTGTHARTFSTRGSFRYRCTFHSTSFTEGKMIGTVTVD